MLTQLHIEHFALIRKLSLDFSPSLNVLTGETGAGKSILIDSLRFVLGERANPVFAQNPGAPTRVEAAFEVSGTDKALAELLEPFSEPGEHVLVLRRELQEGKTRCWVNGRLAAVSTLRSIGARLVDIHGQYDHQLLLDAGFHLGLVDLLAGAAPIREKYAKLYGQYAELSAKRNELKALEADKARELDLLKYQVEEIERAGLDGFDEEALITEKMRLANSEKLHEGVRKILDVLDGRDPSVSSLLIEAARPFKDLVRLDPSFGGPLQSEFEKTQIAFEEITATLRNYQEKLTFDPDRLEEIQDRLRIF